MRGIRKLFTYKCPKGHVTHVMFNPGIKIEDEDETTCSECLKTNVLEHAYVVFVRSATSKDEFGLGPEPRKKLTKEIT
jgi:hypothetical protein